ncbi:unnamed protein product [Caenorhabditis auriculariae]|uniref:DAGKc domain-containing protein n=1 Tax=Caenorhabditis auriculariae TaxID=2777116 RepID=A0A8S1HBM4_9PELO|nr:unnamed protein product [Caenorhabditis auriculariae]
MQACTVYGQWNICMGALCCSSPVQSEEETSVVVVPAVTSTSNELEFTRGNLLVFVNPNSGSGKSLKTFERRVAPLLRRNKIKYELIVTTGRDHAKSVVKTRTDLDCFNGVMILSGDGLVFEVLNGIVDRKDFVALLPNLPLSVVPSGSGNGLLCSVLENTGKSLKQKQLMSSAVEMATSTSSKAIPVSLFHVQTDTQHLLSFLSLGWGLMADIDIESEKWRKTLGSNRFTLGALIRTINLRTYRGRLSFKPYEENIRFATSTFYNVYPETPNSRIRKQAGIHSDESSINGTTDWSELHVDTLVPPLSEQTGPDWTVIEDEFVGVYAVTLSRISADGPFVPNAKLDEDRIHLTYILKRDVSSRMDLINFLSAIESKKHLDMPFLKKVEVSSFRLNTLSEGSFIVVDGEVVDTKSVQITSTLLKTALFAL